jgi:phosphoglycerate dehydrogenase-like enzyme/quinol monooxygenase YgiN
MSPPRTPREPVTIIAELRFDPAHREAVLELARQHVRNTLTAERDCLRFELIAPKDEPGALLFYEMFASDAAFAAHRDSLHSAWFREARAPYGVQGSVRELRPVAPAWPGAVLCAPPVLADHPEYLAALTDAGLEIRWNDRGRILTEDELIERLDGVAATIAGLERYGERVFAAAPGLKVVARLGVGHEHVDLAAATRHGVAVAMAFGTNHDAVADHTIALAAAAAHRIADYDRRVRDGAWGTLLHGGLHEAVMGVVGFGRIGRAVAKRCLGFSMEVLVADPVADADTVARLGYRLVELDELLRQADIVSLHLPQTPATRHLIDARRLALMKPTAILVNTARGGLVDEAALVAALQAERLGGAALDVFEVEPLPDGPLRRIERAVLTPHVAGVSGSSLPAMAGRAAENVLAVLRGHDPGPGLVLNPEVLPPPG